MERLGKVDSNRIIEDFINRAPSTKLGEVSPIESKRQEDAQWFNQNKGVTPSSPNPPTSRIGDYVRTFGAGVPEVGGSVAELVRRSGIISNETAQSIQDNAKMASERLREKTSSSFQKAASQPILNEDKEGNLSLNPDYSSTTLAHDVVASVPGTIATGIGAGGLMKAGGMVLSPLLTRMGIGEVVGSNFPRLAALAERVIPGTADTASKVNKMIATGVAAKGGASVSEGLTAASQNAYQKRQEINSRPFSDFANSPEFNSTLASLDSNMPLDQRMEKARGIIADKAADDIFHNTFASTGGISALTGGGAIGDILSKGGGKITSALAKSVGKGMAEEFAQEFPQSGAEQAISNYADKKYVDPSKDVMSGVADAALKGGVAGGVTGGVIGSISHLSPSAQSNVEQGKSVDTVNVGGQETSITSGKVKSLYNKYLDIHKMNPDTDSSDYKNVKSQIESSLDSLVKAGEGKEVDPVLKGEVEAVKKSIETGHTLQVEQNKRMKEEESLKEEAVKEVIKPDSSPEEQLVQSVPEEAVNTLFSDTANKAVASGHVPQDFKDKRYNFAKRAAYSQLVLQRKQNEINDLSSKLQEANSELRTHPLTSLPNKRAFFEQEAPRVVASVDIDSLKYLNDTLGHEGGDELLKKVTSVLSKYVDAYHISGDEILARGEDKDQLVAGLEAAYKELQSGQHAIDTQTHTFSSPSFSYGISEVKDKTYLDSAIKQADLNMLDAKALREKAGERAGRGEIPKGFSEKVVASPSVPSEPVVPSTPPISLPSESQGVAESIGATSGINVENQNTQQIEVPTETNVISSPLPTVRQESRNQTVNREVVRPNRQKVGTTTKGRIGDFHSSIEKGYQGSANLSTLTTAKLPEIISSKFSDLKEVPVAVMRTTKNSVVVRAGYPLANSSIQLTKEFSIPRTSINDTSGQVETSQAPSTPEPIQPIVPEEIEAPVDLNTEVNADPIESTINELQLQLEDARVAKDFELVRELKQEIEDLGGTVDKVKLDQKKINANLSAEREVDEEEDFIPDSVKKEESYTNFSGDDVDVEYSLEDKGTPKVVNVDHSSNKKALDYIFSNMKGSAVGNMISSGDLAIYYVPDFTDPNYSWPNVIKRQNAQLSFSSRAKGIHIRDNSNNKSYIFLNGAKAKDVGSLVRTFAHEVVGHYGIRSIFGQSKAQLDNYLVRLINSNKAFRDSIFSKKERWIIYYNSFVVDYMAKNGIKSFEGAEKAIASLPSTDVLMYNGKPVPIEVAVMLADEEMAEIAADLFFSEKFLKEQVGLGDRVARLPKTTVRQVWLRDFINRVKHLIRKIFGNYTNDISTNDLTQMIAESVDRLFDNTPISHLKNPTAVRREFIYENVVQSKKPTLSLNKEVRFELDESEDTNTEYNQYATEKLIGDIDSFVKASISSSTNLKENIRSRMWGNLISSIENSKLAGLLVYGNMPHSQVYNHIDTVYKGGVGRVEDAAKTLVSSLKNINSIQNQQIFNFMTTASADPMSMDITPAQREVVVSMKNAIRALGEIAANTGLISKESYEANKDAYLHTVYLDFVKAYKGSGKRTSTMSYRFKKKNKTERQRMELGQIRDVRFLIPETFGTLARDNVLLEMFSTINEASINNNLFWVLTSKDKVKIPGTSKKMTVDAAYHHLDRMKQVYEDRLRDGYSVFEGSGKDLDINILKNDISTLEKNLGMIQNRIIAEAHASSGRDDLSPDNFLKDHYTRLPNSPKLGELSNKLVRKEIANDLEAFTNAFDLTNSTTLQKFFARGGTLERITSFWKMSKIALNPASWFRNIVGNFSLLDLSTSTPSYQLVGMVHDELSSAIKGKESDYWTLAKHYGLFGTTFSAIELQTFFNQYGDMLDASRVKSTNRGDSALDRHLAHFDERLGAVFKLAQHTIGGSTAKGFALVEGTFKTVAFRDYLQQWEKENKASYKSLTGEEQNVLFAKAASHANDAIIDYSKAHSIVKDLRRLPFGDPFLTFTYKSLPILVKSMINHPVKFAKYATLPALLTAISLASNDWEDKDWDKIKAGMTDYHRDNPGMFLLPWKDSSGRVQVADAGYLIPWNQWHIAAKKAYSAYAEDGGLSPFSATGKATYNVFNELGFMGGPAPQAVAAFITGKDSFTGQDIAKPGLSADQKILEYMKYAYNMAVPGWLGSSGWLSKLADAYGIGGNGKPTVDRFGDVKYTPGQAWTDITGFRGVGVNPETGIQNRKLGFDQRLREVATQRSKVIHDKNEPNKATLLKDIALREKLIRKQMREALSGQ